MEKIKKFLEFNLVKAILTIVLFLIFPYPVYYLPTGRRWEWFVGFKELNFITSQNSWDLPAIISILLVLLLFYLISCFLVFIFKKIK